MKKIKCEKYKWYIGSAFFGFLGMSNIFGFQQWDKYKGWQEPDRVFGVILVIIAIAMYKYINNTCDEAKTVKCKECGEVFSKIQIENNKCLKCHGEVVNINEYYSRSNKYEETNTNPQAD